MNRFHGDMEIFQNSGLVLKVDLSAGTGAQIT